VEPTPLTRQTAARIVDYIREHDAPQGTRLVERTLAEQLRVSRSPVRSALHLLHDDGVVGTTGRGGYVVRRTGKQLLDIPSPDDAHSDQALHLRIATDRLDGDLPDRITENALARRYDLGPAQLARILRRINAEGWIERLPGYGWEFQPVLTSLQAYRDSYRFRLLIEPAAILEPAFTVNLQAVSEVREQQQHLVDGEIWTVSDAGLFDRNRAFHEAVMACSHNSFLIDALHRADNLRRLVEYRRSLPRERAHARCQEHIQIADLLLAERLPEASETLRRHLDTVAVEKLAARSGRILV
jgi:DNA-binding GntR family transcriptional regulator